MNDSSPTRWAVPGWESIPGLRHGFFGRRGGVSGGPFASLNVSYRVGDDPAAVEMNRSRVAGAVDAARLATARQVHGDRVIAAAADAEEDEADAVLVRAPGIAAAVLTADCVPLLLVAPEARVAVAVHAGWKGTAAAIAARAVEALAEATGAAPASFLAALGPSIDGCCYEVGTEVTAALAAALGAGVLDHARRLGDKSWIDLRAINAEVLERAGVAPERLQRVGPCTRCAAAEFFSHRASGGRAGRQLSCVGWV